MVKVKLFTVILDGPLEVVTACCLSSINHDTLVRCGALPIQENVTSLFFEMSLFTWNEGMNTDFAVE